MPPKLPMANFSALYRAYPSNSSFAASERNSCTCLLACINRQLSEKRCTLLLLHRVAFSNVVDDYSTIGRRVKQFISIFCVYIFSICFCNVGYTVLLKISLDDKIEQTTVLQGGACLILRRMEVMFMNNFSFQDLMLFGMFILALLTFVFTFRK